MSAYRGSPALHLCVVVMASFVVAACGGTSTGVDIGDAASDVASKDAASDSVTSDSGSVDSSSGDTSTQDGPTKDVAADRSADGKPPEDVVSHDTGAHTFACGPKECSSALDYCSVTEGGPILLDGGDRHYTCEPLPTACKSTPTCACVKSMAMECPGGMCVDMGGDITITCEVP